MRQSRSIARKFQRPFHPRVVVTVMLVEERINVGLGIKRHQIVDLFTRADEANRQIQLPRNGDDDTTFCGAVELR